MAKNRTIDCITIYTDASVCIRAKVGGWACWMKNPAGESLLQSGAFKDRIEDVCRAEMMAIANGLTLALRVYKPKNILFVVVSDCQMAINYLEKKVRNYGKTKPNQAHLDLANKIVSMVPADCKIKFNKVKAHSNKDGKRSYINDLVDKQAKIKMKELRAVYGE